MVESASALLLPGSPPHPSCIEPDWSIRKTKHEGCYQLINAGENEAQFPCNAIITGATTGTFGGTQKFLGQRIGLSGERSNFWGNALDFRGNAVISGATHWTFGGTQ